MAKTILTCAVTGGDDTAGRYAQLPVTPAQIAAASIDAAKAGAAVVHIHVRDPETGKPSMALELYREVVERIRSSDTDVIINLTTGPGARFVPSLEEANSHGNGSNVRTPVERTRHILELRPEICSFDMGTLNFGRGALINTPAQIEEMAKIITESGALPELEIFDAGHLALAQKLRKDGVVPERSFYQFALGIPWGAPATIEAINYFKNAIPQGAKWAAFGVGRREFDTLAMTMLSGGHIRVGFEDNFYLSKGVEAQSNAQLVEKASEIVKLLNGELATPAEARAILGLEAK